MIGASIVTPAMAFGQSPQSPFTTTPLPPLPPLPPPQSTPQSTPPLLPAQVPLNGTFINEADGFKVTLPNPTWGVMDFDNTVDVTKRMEQVAGLAILADLCNSFTSGLGGSSICSAGYPPSSIEVLISRFGNLKDQPDVQSYVLSQGKNITTHDLFLLYQQFLKVAGLTNQDLQVLNATEISPNETIVEVNYLDNLGFNKKAFYLLVLSPDQNTGCLDSGEYPTEGDVKVPEP